MTCRITIFCLLVSLKLSGQNSLHNQNFISIDHIPVVVENLDSVKKIVAEVLFFKIKEGKAHEGIKNCFTKFEDGTYLEFISPLDSLQTIGKYYQDFLKTRQGATQLAISVLSTKEIANRLKRNAIPYEADSNRIWKTLSPQGMDLFFIEYNDKSWKDSKSNTTHPNQSLLLKSVFYVSDNMEADLYRFKTLGCTEIQMSTYLGIPLIQIAFGRNQLYLMDTMKAKKLTAKFGKKKMKGICGFEIKVRSLKALKTHLTKGENISISKNRITCYLKDYNLFFIFSE